MIKARKSFSMSQIAIENEKFWCLRHKNNYFYYLYKKTTEISITLGYSFCWLPRSNRQ